jgi:SAM-dependent methyltransferase
VDSGTVFAHFIAWHDGDPESGNAIRVPLYCVTPTVAGELAAARGLPTTDIALWEKQYALLFIPTGEDNEQIVRMCFADDRDLYERCIGYLDDLDGVKQSIDEVLNLFPEEMADAWSQYVDEPARQAKVGGVLSDVLQPFIGTRVLDAAAGLGTETEWLMNNGFPDVVSNELESQLNARLCVRLTELGVPIEHAVSNYDWRELDQRYMHGIFSVVLALGNSLCLIENTEDRLRCLEAWAEVMRPGGVLIIDERNWDYFYKNRDELLEDPLKAYEPPRAMYYGTTVRSVPVKIVSTIGSERIELLFYRNGHVATLEGARTKEHLIGTIDMFPILNPRLTELLDQTGFKVQRIYSDLIETPAPQPDATFYTYVAVKR